jgi:type II secretory pathway pseudopilin PulG
MTTYTMTITAMAFILAALLLREKVRRTEAVEEAEVLREQFKDLRTILENDRAEYMRAYTTLRKAGYTDNGHPLWTPPDQGRTARMMEEHRYTIKRLRQTVRSQRQELHNLKRVNAQADLRDRSLSDDWPPYGHGIETETKTESES